jgi:hypothetical protein
VVRVCEDRFETSIKRLAITSELPGVLNPRSRGRRACVAKDCVMSTSFGRYPSEYRHKRLVEPNRRIKALPPSTFKVRSILSNTEPHPLLDHGR